MSRRAGALSSHIVAAIAVAAFAPAAAAQQQPPASDRPLTSSMQVPIEGTVPGACQGDLVPVAGELNAIARVRLTPRLNAIEVYLSLHNVKGVGSVSGMRYLGLGAAQFSADTDAGPPKLQSYRANFMLWGVSRPTNPCVGDPDKVQALPITVALKFDAEGALTGVEASVRPAGR